MPAAISDYLQRPSGGNVTVLVGTWVQLTNNVSGTAYVSTAVTDANGKFTVLNVPAGTYTVATGPTSGGPFTSTGDSNYVVADYTGWLNALDFGAKGDGTTDDATAINAALTFAGNNGGGIVTLPKRPTAGITVYAVGAAIIVPANVELHCGGRNAVWIQALPGITLGANGEVVRLIGGTSIGVGCRFTDGLVNANNVAASKCWYSERINENSGIYRSAGINFLSRGIHIAQPSTGVGPQHWTIDDVELQTSASTPAGAIAIDVNNTSVATPIRAIRSVSIGGTTALTVAVRLDGVTGGAVEHMHIENMTTGIDISPNLACFGLGIKDIDGLANVTNLVRVNNVGGTRSIIIEDIFPNGGTNALVDNRVGNTITRDIGTYVIGAGGAVIASDGAVKSVLGPLQVSGAFSPATPAAATQLGALYQGSGAPSNTNGNNGDVYFRTDTPGTVNQRIYIKSAGSWTGIV